MKNKKIYIISVTVLFVLFVLYFFFYPKTFKCGVGGKKIEQTFFNVNIYGEKDIKDAECKRKNFWSSIYECMFTFENNKFDIIIDKDLYVIFELPFQELDNNVFDLCNGKVLTINNKNYCILYKCSRM